MKNVVLFRPPATFAEFGIDWARAAQTEREQTLREAFLTYEASCGPNGLVSILLLAVVSRRQGAVADDLQAAADDAEILLGLKLRKHQHDSLDAVHDYVTHGGAIWS